MHLSILLSLLIVAFTSQATAYSVYRPVSSVRGIYGRSGMPHARSVEPEVPENVATAVNHPGGDPCQLLGTGCKLQDDKPIPQAPSTIRALANSTDAPSNQSNETSDGGNDGGNDPDQPGVASNGDSDAPSNQPDSASNSGNGAPSDQQGTASNGGNDAPSNQQGTASNGGNDAPSNQPDSASNGGNDAPTDQPGDDPNGGNNTSSEQPNAASNGDNGTPSDQPGDESNGGHEISKGHFDGSKNHTFTVKYGATSIPVGVCNPQKMLQIVMDRGCSLGDKNMDCTVKGEWPCDYIDDTAKGGWTPDDEGQRAVRKCTLGINAHFLTSLEDRPVGMADVLKKFALKAMEPPMQVQGGNVSLAPLSGRPGTSAPPNVTAWTVPARMLACSYYSNKTEDPMGDLTAHEIGFIDVKIACPAEKSKNTSNCGMVSALVGLATAILAIFAPEAEPVLGAIDTAAASFCGS